MSYSDLYTESRFRPPNWLYGLAVLAVVSAFGFYFSSNSPLTKASPQHLVRQEIVNVLPQQAGVFWEIDAPDHGWIIYGDSPDNLSNIALDEDSNSSKDQKKIMHYAVMKNFKPETTYYYKIVSNDSIIASVDDKPFSVKTISSTLPSSTLSPAYGKVMADGGEPVIGAFVFVEINNAFPLLTNTTQNGEWLIPMQYIVRKDTSDVISVENDTIIDIKVRSGDASSFIKTTISNTHPLPQTIILGSNYSFVGKSKVLSASNRSMTQAPSLTEVSIQYPKENAVIPASKPLIKGKGIPGRSVDISINTNPVTQMRTKVDEKGNWYVQMVKPLSPQSYTLSFVTTNERSRTLKIDRKFTILKSGERVLGEQVSTPSATITGRPTGSVTSTLTPTTSQISPTSAASSPTPIPTLGDPTPTDSLNYDTSPTATPPPPVSGIMMVPYMVAGIGLVLLGTGLVLFL